MSGPVDSLTSGITSLPEDCIVSGWCKHFEDGPKSITVESSVEDSFFKVPNNLTFAKVANILNNEIIRSIDNYENIFFVDPDSENFKKFCSQQLNLNLEERSDHRHIYSNILSQYKRNQELKCDYSVKELVLLVAVANDKLIGEYKEILFNQENLILLSLLVGSQRYIEIFTEKFHEIYTNLNLKEQVIKTPSGQVNFFSVIALRKEQAFLQAVLVEYVLKDLVKTLQISCSDPLYGVFETAPLAKNEPFVTIVLDIFENHADDEIKKGLLSRSIITLLDAAISQEHVSIVEHLCERYIGDKTALIQEIYKEALANQQVIMQIKIQVLKNIHSVDMGRKKKKQEIYKAVLKTALVIGNVEFLTKVLHLIENDPKFSTDEDKQSFFQSSLITILENAISAKSFLVIECLCRRRSNDIIKALKNKEGEEVKKLAAKNILNNVEELVKKAVHNKDLNSLRCYLNSLEASVACVKLEESLPTLKRIREVVDKFAKEQGEAWDRRPAIFLVENAYTNKKYIEGYISHQEYEIVQGLIPGLKNLKNLLENKKNITASPVINVASASNSCQQLVEDFFNIGA